MQQFRKLRTNSVLLSAKTDVIRDQVESELIGIPLQQKPITGKPYYISHQAVVRDGHAYGA